MRTRQLNAIIAALESSKPTHDHYPEPVQRHQDALAAAKHLLAIADHSLMPGIAEHALAGEIVAAVLADEQGEGCDLSAGMFGPQMTVLIRRIVDVYLGAAVATPVYFVRSGPDQGWEESSEYRYDVVGRLMAQQKENPKPRESKWDRRVLFDMPNKETSNG